ncbi:hypothetical protein SAMN04487830_11544 [Pseudobutyrivibrio sp. OR37]|uniref:hypothetical protein n=1 Tax=Pseudobutyrivibrio sp. OR37 TaxID=1798186 RepID=UPI0008E639E7|nr:hypothetical protein [Pseudobutyrivibrio sp. OR37]SFH97855.1 hypothetical protein SAMN04487830_11544 [Pseudobutyrivibrio sp. OR37]
MKKIYLNIVLALMVTVASFTTMAATAQAEEEKVEWTVEFTGKGDTGFEPVNPDDLKALKEKISDAMPGDTIVFKANYKNSTDKTMDFFLAADVLASLEDDKNGKAAEGGAYTYMLTYDSGKGETIIYNSETVGGDNDSIKGLNQLKNNNAFVSIGTLAKKKQGVVTLTIKLDGNSQDNRYMSKLAQLNVQFAAKEPSNPKPTIKKITKTKHIVETIPGGTEIVQLDDEDVPLDRGLNPKTGDSIIPIVGCALALVIGLGFIGLYFVLMKRAEKEV